MVVGHGLFDQGDLEVGVGLGAEQVVAHHGLVEVGGHLGHEERVAAVDKGLEQAAVVGVQRVAQLVRQRAQAEHVVGIAHHDEGHGALGAAGEGALALALVARPVHPTLFQAATPQDADVVVAQRGHALADPVDGLLEGHHRLVLGDGSLDVVDVQLVVAQQAPAQAPVAVPGRQVLLEDLDQVVEDLDRDVVGRQRGVQGGLVAAHPGIVDILLERGGQGGGHGVLELQVAVGVVLPGGAAHGPVGVGDQAADAGLADLQRAAIGGDRRLEGQVGVVEGVVDRRAAEKGSLASARTCSTSPERTCAWRSSSLSR